MTAKEQDILRSRLRRLRIKSLWLAPACVLAFLLFVVGSVLAAGYVGAAAIVSILISFAVLFAPLVVLGSCEAEKIEIRATLREPFVDTYEYVVPHPLVVLDYCARIFAAGPEVDEPPTEEDVRENPTALELAVSLGEMRSSQTTVPAIRFEMNRGTNQVISVDGAPADPTFLQPSDILGDGPAVTPAEAHAGQCAWQRRSISGVWRDLSAEEFVELAVIATRRRFGGGCLIQSALFGGLAIAVEFLCRGNLDAQLGGGIAIGFLIYWIVDTVREGRRFMRTVQVGRVFVTTAERLTDRFPEFAGTPVEILPLVGLTWRVAGEPSIWRRP